MDERKNKDIKPIISANIDSPAISADYLDTLITQKKRFSLLKLIENIEIYLKRLNEVLWVCDLWFKYKSVPSFSITLLADWERCFFNAKLTPNQHQEIEDLYFSWLERHYTELRNGVVLLMNCLPPDSIIGYSKKLSEIEIPYSNIIQLLTCRKVKQTCEFISAASGFSTILPAVMPQDDERRSFRMTNEGAIRRNVYQIHEDGERRRQQSRKSTREGYNYMLLNPISESDSMSKRVFPMSPSKKFSCEPESQKPSTQGRLALSDSEKLSGCSAVFKMHKPAAQGRPLSLDDQKCSENGGNGFPFVHRRNERYFHSGSFWYSHAHTAKRNQPESQHYSIPRIGGYHNVVAQGKN